MRFSTRRSERKYKMRQFGTWIEENKKAQTLTLLMSIPIKYVNLHLQLNPYLPGNAELDAKKVPSDPNGDIPVILTPTTPGGYDMGWRAIRRKIIKRDKYRCTTCGSQHSLEVHHKAEKVGTPEADNLDNLRTLCSQCHRKIPAL